MRVRGGPLAVAAVLVAAAGCVGESERADGQQGEPISTTEPVIADQPVAEDGVLPVPAVGEALPAYLEDGRPVFVSHPEEGDVVVVDAEDSRTVGGWRQLVTYCPSSGWFTEARHASRFNGWGEWTGGPSPAGLAPYPSELIDDGNAVRVTGPRQAHPGRDVVHDQRPQGPPCVTDERHRHVRRPTRMSGGHRRSSCCGSPSRARHAPRS